ncbi:MAG: hypothetical protein OHK93_005014 [Ramalina farinacea]|uniref:Uncharacterized protein n=1 Tax=Ramalina farinacea TaxID=258253 RepID=A0AA43QXJ6_9LECA|nr:hypothetical protein [Ramalina farinacea]
MVYSSDDEDGASDDEDGASDDEDGASDDKQEGQGKGKEFHHPFTIPLPYWQIYREGDKKYFAVSKTEQNEMKTADQQNETEWVPDASAGDTFLALGWLME